MRKVTASGCLQDESIRKGKLWLVTAAGGEGKVNLSFKNTDRITINVTAGDYAILACEGRFHSLDSDNVIMHRLCFQQLCKLQAFIDECLNVPSQPSTTPSAQYGYWPLSTAVTINDQHQLVLDFEFLSQFSSGMEMGNVTRILRKSEEYSLVRYLLQVSDSLNDLDSISARYGLSPSHFRRLMRKALGNGVKAELKKWRLTRALLASFQEEKRLTDTAMNHGYASLSHFSTDVRKLFGLSHREIKQSIINRNIK